MENNERQDNKLMIDRDAQIQVVVNSAGEEEDVIDLGRVFHTMKLKWRIYAWVLVLCLTVGACAPLVLYQFTREPLTVSAVVTLKNYEIEDPDLTDEELEELEEEQGPDFEKPLVPVNNLTAPDGEELDLSQVTSAYVLQQALDGIALSTEVSLADIRSNVSVQRILSEESKRQQELAASMVEAKSAEAYATIKELELRYENTFVVSLTNGFGKEKAELREYELKQVLENILSAYNDYLVETYADMQLPDDMISVIDVENNDILESLDQLRTAVQALYDYCDEKPDQIKEYRVWRTGRSLADWMETLKTMREVNVDYLYSYVYTNSIVRDRDAMVTSYQYQLREAQTQLDTVNEGIETLQEILDRYKNDEIYVSMQESDAAKSTKTTTDYYNELILQQAENYKTVEPLETKIADLQEKIASLSAIAATDVVDQEKLDEANAELENAIETSLAAYKAIRTHMEDLMEQPLCTTYAEHSAALGKQENFLVASMKNMLIGIAAGAVIALGLWFLSGLAPEFRHKKEEEADKTGDRSDKPGKEAAEA